MTLFRPCIDLHGGCVKQIVGESLREGEEPETHFVAEGSAAEYAALYRRDDLSGGHVIKLGPGNDEAARAALEAYPGGLQLGGGVDLDNAVAWLDVGAAKVIVTSALFDGRRLDLGRVADLSRAVGRERLVLDLSCRRVDGGYRVAKDRWQTLTEASIDSPTLDALATHCSELLVHAADVEGKQRGIDLELVALLAQISPIPVTYAGGARSTLDLATVEQASGGRVDLTIGSALDIFGGEGARYEECVEWNRRRGAASRPPERRN